MRFFLFLFIVGSVWEVRGQTPLDNQLRTARHDTIRLRLYNDIIRYYSNQSQNDSVWRYIQRALPLAHKYPKKDFLIRIYYRIGLLYRDVNKYDSSLYYCQKALQLSNQQGNTQIAVAIRYCLAVVYADRGDKAASYKQLIDNIHYYEKIKNYKWMSSSYGLLSEISSLVGRKDRVPYFKQKQLEFLFNYGENEDKILALLNMANDRKEKGDLEAAYKNLTTALSMAEQYNSVDEQLLIMGLIADNLLLQRRFVAALHLQQKKLGKARIAGLSIPLAESYTDISSIYLGLGKSKMALKYAQIGYQWALKTKQPECILASMKELISAHKANNQYQIAFSLQEKQTVINDSLSFLNQATRIATFEAEQAAKLQTLREDTLTKSLKINELYINKLQSEKRLYWILFGLGVLILAGVLYFWRQTFQMNKLLSEQKQQVERQTEELRDTNHVKDKLFGIIGHDLRAPLVSFQNQMQLFENNMMDAPSFFKQFKRVQSNVRQLYQTLDNLLYWSLSQQQKLKSNPHTLELAELIEDVLSLYAGLVREKKLTVENKVNGQRIFADEQHTKIVLTNVLQNAIKFSPLNEVIEITSEVTPSSVLIKVSNRSHTLVELPDRKNGTGLGLVLIEELMKQNNGQWQMTTEGNGTVCVRLKWFSITELSLSAHNKTQSR